MKFIASILVFLFVFMSSLEAQITVIATPASPSSENSLRVKPTLAFSDPIESINGEDILTSNAGENQVLVRDLLSLKSNGINIDFTASINANDDLILIEPNEILLPQTTYIIGLASIRKKDADNETLSASTYTFTTGKAVEVNNLLKENICIGDPAGIELEPIVITENLADNFINLETAVEQLSLSLDAPEGFIFTAPGTATNTTTDNPKDVIIIGTNLSDDMKSLILNYKLCPDANCTSVRTAASDIITLTGVAVAATGTDLISTNTYSIIRGSGTGAQNDAVMPGLGAGAVFARLQVAESPPLVLTV